MKPLFLTLVLLLPCFALHGEPPATKGEFLAALRAAYESKDVNRIRALTWTKGASAADEHMMTQVLTMSLKNKNTIKTVTLDPLPPDYESVFIAMGKKWDPTYKPDGMATVVYDSPYPHPTKSSTSTPYAQIDGHYFLVEAKSTDLAWTGPPDKMLRYFVAGAGSDKVKIDFKYNVSGANVEKTAHVASAMFPGQYFDEVTVTSTEDNTNVNLELSEGPIKNTVFKSPPLKGKGTIHYKRSASGENKPH
jgi:hypothetical protein